MQRNGQPIEEAWTRHGIRTGITFGSLIPGVVPLFEEREAARFEGYTPKEWRRLSYEDRVQGVTHYRLHNLVELHENDAVAETIKAKEK